MRKRHIALHTWQTYRVDSLGGDQRIADRLAQMGILPGVEFTIVRIGPMGNPLELAIDGGQSIVLRNTDVRALNCTLISLPLSATQPDTQHYRISALQGSPRYRQKLAALGLQPGNIVRVEATRPYQLRLVEDGRLIRLGQTEAQYLILQPVETNA
jgi:Fe2+ transport system protein FeoA